jgi:phosphatidylglycerophosphate synthase
MDYQVNEADRRPIVARKAQWAHHVTAVLARGGVSPNAISIAGMFFALLGGAFLAATPWVAVGWARVLLVAAAVLAVMRLMANLFDGMVAVARGIASPVGELYNEIPDRVSDAAFLIGAGSAVSGQATWGWSAALVAVLVAYVRTCGRACGAPSFFSGPMAKPHRMWLLVVVCLAMAGMPSAWWYVRPDVGLLAIALGVIVVGGLLTAVRRIMFIANALRAKNT